MFLSSAAKPGRSFRNAVKNAARLIRGVNDSKGLTNTAARRTAAGRQALKKPDKKILSFI
jgi:hypothetical protein